MARTVKDVNPVLKATHGDQEAFSGLVTSHYKMVYGLALSTVKDPGSAEDIAQDAFLVSWTNLQKLDNPKAFSTWLRKITRNLSLTWIRSRGYRKALTERQTALLPDPTDEAPEQEQRASRKERFEIIRSALGTLSPKIRESLVLFYLEGQSVAETARSLGISEGATKLRLMQGRRKLREHFESQLDSDLREAICIEAPGMDRAQIAKVLSVGPVLPAIGESVSGSGTGLIVHEFIHSGPSSVASFMKTGGVIMSTKKLGMVIGVVILLCLGGLLTLPGYIDRHQEESTEISSLEPHDVGADEFTDENFADTPDAPADVDADIERETPIAASDSLATQAAVRNESPDEEKEPGKIEDPALFASVSGTVVDLKGNPIANAEVVVSASGFDELFNPNQTKSEIFKKVETLRKGSHMFSTKSGPGGKYTVEGIEYEGMAFLRAMAFGYAQPRKGSMKDVTLKPGDHLEHVDILLVEGVTLEGSVVSKTGEPAVDAVVSVIGYTQGQSTNSMTGQLTRTDENGWFMLSFDAPSTAAIDVNSPVHGHATFMGVDIYEGAVTKLKMPTPAMMLGSITWGDRSPASGVTVSLEGQWHDPANRGDRLLGHGTTFEAIVGKEGNYQIAPLDPAQFYKVSLLKPGGQPLSPPIDIGIPEEGGTIKWDHRIADAIKVHGTVFGQETRQPLTNVKVAVLKDGVKMGDTEAIVGDDGTYQLTILGGEGQYHIYPRYWRLDPVEDGFFDSGETIRLTPGDDQKQDLYLPGTFSMSFQVVDAAARPVEGVMLSVRDPGHSWGPAGYTDAEGRWKWSGFIAGYETGIVVHAAGRRRIESAAVIGEPGEIVPEEILVLQEYGGIEGTALDPNGQPIPKVPVTITVHYGEEAQTTFTVQTDDVGDFVVLDQVPATFVQLHLEINSGPGDLPLPLTWESELLETLAEQIINLGNIPFAGVTSEPNKMVFSTD
jgi:RNA polymerase sigma-70 factor (ECF subfamily)